MTEPQDNHIKGASGRVVDALAKRQRLIHIAATVFSVFILALSVVVLVRTFAALSWGDLRAALLSTGWDQISLALLMTSLSYLALTGYDALALRQLGLRVPYGVTALASFTSYSVSFTLGFPLITAGTVRYWIYSQSGLSAGKVASLTIIASITFWLGMGLIIGVSLIADPAGVAAINHLKTEANFLLGLGAVSVLAAWLAWVSVRSRRVHVQGMSLELPGFWLTTGQTALGVADLCAASATLFMLLPRGSGVSFLDFAATYAFSCLLGIASNAPGGIGAFEMTMLNSVRAPTTEGMIASLLLFRVIYYLVPFVLALALLGAYQIMRQWSSLRADMSAGGDDRRD